MFFILNIFLYTQSVWIEKTHQDFVDGNEWHEFTGNLIQWELGSRVYSPASGGLRIISQDWDINNDSWVEAVLTRQWNSQVRVYWNSSLGFNLSNYLTLLGSYSAPQGVSIADLNNDTLEDIIVCSATGSYGNGKTLIYYQNSDGTFPIFPSDSLSYSPLEAQYAFPCDWNNDGNLDIILSGLAMTLIYLGPPPFYNTPKCFTTSKPSI